MTALLDDGCGQIKPGLRPLFDSLMGMPTASSGLAWIHNGYIKNMLRGLAQGGVPLTHEGLHQMPRPNAAAHLRDLLMACGILPYRDRQLCMLEYWLVRHLADIPDLTHRQIINRFATWAILPALRTKASAQPLSHGSRAQAGTRIILATGFLAWLAEQNLDLNQCRQSVLDAWTIDNPAKSRDGLRVFLRWAADNRLTSHPLELRARRRPAPSPLPEQQRLALLGRVVTDDTIPLRNRVAAVLVLLYAQPVSRIVRLTTDDVIEDADQVLIRLGHPLLPVPEPIAAMLLEHIAGCNNTHPTINPQTTWLFPGRRTGQHLHDAFLTTLLNQMGIPTTASRGAALRQHIRDSPPAVVAEALGYSPGTTAKIASQAGLTYSRYAPGDHSSRRDP